MKVIDVVAAIIYNTERTEVLLALRKPEQHQGNCWEFPGGKQEPQETEADALSRELREEIGIVVTESEPFTQIQHGYSDKTVRLKFWSVYGYTGTPEGLEGQRLQWYPLSSLAELTFPDANKPVVERLLVESPSA